jgi:ATP-dependent Clp protease ATP-binding subunit ClpA
MLKEATSFLKKEIKDADLQDRAIKLLNSAFSYVELDKKKQENEAQKKELAAKKQPKSKED